MICSTSNAARYSLVETVKLQSRCRNVMLAARSILPWQTHLEVSTLNVDALAPGEPGEVGVPGCLLERLLRWVDTKAHQPGAAAITKHKVQLGQAVAHDLICQIAVACGLQCFGVVKAQHGCV